MAAIPTFDAQAPRRGTLDVSGIGTGGAETWNALANGASRIAAKLGGMADKARVAEGIKAGNATGNGVAMPTVDFAFETVKGPDGKPAGGRQVNAPAAVRDAISKAAQKHGVDPSALMRIAEIESSLNPNAKNPKSSAGGLFQFIDSTAAQYGLTNKFDPYQAADAGARLMKDNAAYLRSKLGREPTAGELYLAHQQGPGGAVKLLANPNAAAASVVGGDAIRLNGGREGMSAGEFAAIWTSKAGGGTSAPTQKMTASVTGSFGALPEAKAGTLYGDAFNSAALDSYMNRADTALRAGMDAIALQHPEDPAAMADALDAQWQGMAAELPDAARAPLELTYQRARSSLTFQAADAFNKKLERDTLASFEENIMARTDAALRRAAALPNTPEGDAALAGELGELTARIDASNLDPAEKSRKKRELENDVLSARVMAGFNAEKDPQKRADYAGRFDEEWKASEGFAGKIDAATRDKINGSMAKALQDDQQAAEKRGTALQKTIDGQIGFLKKGLPVSAASISAIRSEVERTGSTELSANLGFLEGLATWQKAYAGQPPQAIAGQITELKRQMAEKGATDAAIVTLDVMETLQTNMIKALATDPLSFAQGAGTARIQPLDFSDGAKLQQTLAGRVADAKSVASRYGIEPKYFTEAERDGLSKILTDNPASLPQLASGLVSALGSDAPAALKEISKDAPVLAHMGGLILANGNQRFAVDVAEGMAMRTMDGYKSAMPGDKALADAASEAMGASMSRDPETAARAIETATAAFERRMAKKGLGIKDFETAGSPARAEFQAAVNEALGATVIGGVQYGGITEVNGLETVAPADMPANEVQSAIDGITAEDVAAFGIKPANGVPFTAAQLRRAQLLAVGDGRYRLALGDPFSDEPKIMKAADGNDYVLDIRALAKRKRSENGAFGSMTAPAEQFGEWDAARGAFVVPQ